MKKIGGGAFVLPDGEPTQIRLGKTDMEDLLQDDLWEFWRTTGTNADPAEVQPAAKPRDTILLLLAMLVGAVLLIYPSASDYWNSFHQTQAVMRYAEEVARMSEAEYSRMIGAAADYNLRLSRRGIDWMAGDEYLEEYNSLLNISGTGIMGYIDIPKINVKLPIFHGTDEKILQTSIGHLQETSLPVGGPGSHCVLSGHRGLPSARLFSDLDLMADGDTFTLSILNETCTYEVDQIRVVLPSDVSELMIEEGKDLCTLVTCTPYGINSHRMLVRGHRVKNTDGEARVVADALQLAPTFVAPFFMAPMVLALLAVLFLFPGH